MNKAVFIDKDGTLIPDIPHNTNPELVDLYAGAVSGLKALKNAGFLLIVITNQSGIARGYFSHEQFALVRGKIEELLSNAGIELDGFLHCPHDPEGNVMRYAVDCECRTPTPGMLIQAAEQWHISLSSSWMIGDILNDIEAGKRAGCKAVLINNGGETEWISGMFREPDFTAPDIEQAAEYILKNEYERELGGL